MPKLPTAEAWTQKMLDRVSNAGSAWEAGVQSPKNDPVQAMKNANGKYKAAMQAALQQDRWLKKVSGLSAASISAAAIAAGGGKYVAGVQQRKDKIQASIARLIPKVQSVQAKVAAMPQDTEQQREARMVENLRGMRAIRGS